MNSTLARLRAALAERPAQHSLPGLFYSDPDAYELDLQAVFHRQWIFAGLDCEIPAPGDYFTVAIGRSSVVVLRDDSGAVRAFFNTCRHRGSRICLDAAGHKKRLVCPYHKWTYGLDGALVAAGHMHEGFERKDHGLVPVHVGSVGGMVYLCLADDPPDFAPFRAALHPYLAPHDLANARLAVEDNIVEAANWKLVVENSRECYHCPTGHPSLMRTFLAAYNFMDPAQDAAVEGFWTRCEGMGLPSRQLRTPQFRTTRLPLAKGALSNTMDGRLAVARRLGNVPSDEIGSLRFVHFPSVFAHVLGDYAVTFRMLPLGPRETLLTTKWFVAKDAKEGVDYDPANLATVWRATNDEDRGLCERNQLGVDSVGYRPGPYSQTTERGVIDFVDWYCGTVGSHLDAELQPIAAAPRVRRRA